MSGKENQRRGKTQEYRLKAALEKMDGVEIIKYYGQREGGAGDFLVQVGRRRVRFDHKSTKDDTVIRLQRKWLEKLVGENMLRMDEEGTAIPVISFTIGGKRGIYVMTKKILGAPQIDPQQILGIHTKLKSCPITGGMLNDYGVIQISFSNYAVYIYTLQFFIARVKEHG